MRFIKYTPLIIFILLSGCAERSNPCDPGSDNYRCIQYPEMGLYGDNLLRESSISISTGSVYSLCVDQLESASVRIVISPLTNWKYYLLGIKGWIDITALTPGKRIFYSDSAGRNDLTIQFESTGAILIEIYENDSETPARTKYISW